MTKLYNGYVVRIGRQFKAIPNNDVEATFKVKADAIDYVLRNGGSNGS